MTTIEDIRELLSDMQKYCDVIEDCETSHKAKVEFAKLLVKCTGLLQEHCKNLLIEVENEQPKQNDN